MILVENINFLKRSFPQIYMHFKESEHSFQQGFLCENARNGEKTLVVEKDKNYYLHSRYNPTDEAEIILEQYENIEQYDHVLFYGTGFCYYIEKFTQLFPNKSFSIYEPVAELFYQCISQKVLPTKGLTHLQVGGSAEEIEVFLETVLQNSQERTLIVELPAHRNIYPEQHDKFFSLFKELIKTKRSSIQTDFAFQKRWILSSMQNFGQLFKTPNILSQKKGVFKGKAAVIVSAGPSLDEEIDNLRFIKDNGLAYIFSVGSAINSLIHHNIHPHAACTYDPGLNNNKVFQKVTEEGITDIPLIYGSTSGLLISEYPGKTAHMFISQDTIAKYFIRAKNGQELNVIPDAPSIAVITLQLLYYLGFSEIIFVGQNLAYKGKKWYAGGISHAGNLDLKDEQIKDAVVVKDVYGDDIYTANNLNSFRLSIESYINLFKGQTNFINATKGGADIAGASFCPLEEIIKEHLTSRIVDEDWLKMPNAQYDIDFLTSQLDKMQCEYEGLQDLMNKLDSVIKKIEGLARNRNHNQLEKEYTKLDGIFHKITSNDCFEVFLGPMNRIYVELHKSLILQVRYEKNQALKAKTIVEEYSKLNFLCKKDAPVIKLFLSDIRNELLAHS
jgi:hypothetical protein